MTLNLKSLVLAVAMATACAIAPSLRGDKGGRSEEIREEGKVLHAEGASWVVDFDDNKNIAWKRGELRFVSRPGAQQPVRASRKSAPARRADSDDSDSSADALSGAEAEADVAHDEESSAEEEEPEPSIGRVGRAGGGAKAAATAREASTAANTGRGDCIVAGSLRRLPRAGRRDSDSISHLLQKCQTDELYRS